VGKGGYLCSGVGGCGCGGEGDGRPSPRVGGEGEGRPRPIPVPYEGLRTDGLGGKTLGELELDDTPAPPIPAWAKGICRVLTLERGEGPLRLPPLVVPALKGWRALRDGRRIGRGVGDEGRSEGEDGRMERDGKDSFLRRSTRLLGERDSKAPAPVEAKGIVPAEEG
jgi:hypothetical protein